MDRKPHLQTTSLTHREHRCAHDTKYDKLGLASSSPATYTMNHATGTSETVLPSASGHRGRQLTVRTHPRLSETNPGNGIPQRPGPVVFPCGNYEGVTVGDRRYSASPTYATVVGSRPVVGILEVRPGRAAYLAAEMKLLPVAITCPRSGKRRRRQRPSLSSQFEGGDLSSLYSRDDLSLLN